MKKAKFSLERFRFEGPDLRTRSKRAASAFLSSSSQTQKRAKHIKVEEDNDEEEPLVLMQSMKQTKTEKRNQANKTNVTPPADWETVWELISEMRKGVTAPVDTMGCASLGDHNAEPKDFRYQTLLALMLSSQTKDQVTAAAMGRLKAYFKAGLTAQSVALTDEAVLRDLIHPVGFFRQKASYLKITSQMLVDELDGDIPNSVKMLCKLKGVGPKMAHLTMQEAWGICEGIGVDLHVHRICNRLKWVGSTKNPEATRMELETWLPKEKWGLINKLLVGFGQTQCGARNPSCSGCLVRSLCAEGRKNTRYVPGDGEIPIQGEDTSLLKGERQDAITIPKLEAFNNSTTQEGDSTSSSV